jgi:AcrR family transcriptional regulator
VGVVPSPTRRRLDPAARQAEIVTVAAHHFAERGFEATSTAEVAADAGVTRALVHHYFGDKAGLFHAVVRRLADSAAAIPTADVALALPERVAGNIDHWLDFLERHRGTWLATAAHGDNIADPDILAAVERGRDSFVNRMITCYPEALTRARHKDLALRAYFGFNQAACRQWLTGQASRNLTHQLLASTLLHLLHSTIPTLHDPDDDCAPTPPPTANDLDHPGPGRRAGSRRSSPPP